jgi:CPA1 family monovalent cation:H+ antiporter
MVLFFAARAGIVYGLTPIANRWLADPVLMNYRHILVWGALHTVVPIALAVSLPPPRRHNCKQSCSVSPSSAFSRKEY